MKNIEKALSDKGKYVSYKPADEELVRIAESKLSLKFSKDYRKYVMQYGSVSYLGHELSGVTNCPEDDVVELTEKIKSVHSEIPQSWYVLENTGIDGLIIWQDEQGHIYKGLDKICDSLVEYIEST